VLLTREKILVLCCCFALFCSQNKANPTALLLSGVMMLKHMGLMAEASNIENAIMTTLAEGQAPHW